MYSAALSACLVLAVVLQTPLCSIWCGSADAKVGAREAPAAADECHGHGEEPRDGDGGEETCSRCVGAHAAVGASPDLSAGAGAPVPLTLVASTPVLDQAHPRARHGRGPPDRTGGLHARPRYLLKSSFLL